MNQSTTATTTAMAILAEQKGGAVQVKKLTTSASAPTLSTVAGASDKESKVSNDVYVEWPADKWSREAKAFFYREKRDDFTQVQVYAVAGQYWRLLDLLEQARTLHVLGAVLLDPVVKYGKYYACNVLHIAAINNYDLMVRDILTVAQSANLLAKVLFQPHRQRPSDMFFSPEVDNRDPIWSELHEAAERGNVYIVASLLETAKNNKIAVPNIEGAVTIAWRNKKPATVQIFERYGYIFYCALCEKSLSTCRCNYEEACDSEVARDTTVVREASWLARIIAYLINGCRNPFQWDDED
jgi:hypothetical protein